MNYEEIFQQLIERLAPELPNDEAALVVRAFEVARAAHDGQLRDEGTPYIVHPVRVASTLVNELDVITPRLVCAALLHDVIEDCATTREEIAELFNEEVAEVVWLLTKLEEVSLADYLSAIEAAGSTGAPIVKLCDRLDNLRFLPSSPRIEKIHRYIRTTERYYLPMAARTNRYLHNELSRSLAQVRNHLADAKHA